MEPQYQQIVERLENVHYHQIGAILQGLSPDEAGAIWEKEGLAGEWPSRWVLISVNGQYEAMPERQWEAASWPEGYEVERIA